MAEEGPPVNRQQRRQGEACPGWQQVGERWPGPWLSCAIGRGAMPPCPHTCRWQLWPHAPHLQVAALAPCPHTCRWQLWPHAPHLQVAALAPCPHTCRWQLWPHAPTAAGGSSGPMPPHLQVPAQLFDIVGGESSVRALRSPLQVQVHPGSHKCGACTCGGARECMSQRSNHVTASLQQKGGVCSPTTYTLGTSLPRYKEWIMVVPPSLIPTGGG